MRSYQIAFTHNNHTLSLITGVNTATQSHSTQYAWLSAEHAHFRGKLRPADEK